MTMATCIKLLNLSRLTSSVTLQVSPVLCSGGLYRVWPSRNFVRRHELGASYTTGNKTRRRLLNVDGTTTQPNVIVLPYPGFTLSCPSPAPSYTNLISSCPSSSMTTEHNQVEQVLKTLKLKLERLGQVNRRDLSQAVVKLETQQDELSDGDCWQLLQVAVRVAARDYRPCSRLLHRVWTLTTFRPHAKLTLEHIELYLEACLLTETPCTLDEVTLVLEQHGLEASGRVLSLALGVAGVAGDTATTTAVLVAMKDRGIPATQDTFAALLLAHAVAGDEAGIRSVEETMMSVKMSATSTTLAALMTGHARAGQVVAMKQVVQQAGQLGLKFTEDQLTALILALARTGHAGHNYDNLDWVMEVMNEAGGGSGRGEVELSHTLLQLIHLGQPREAFHLLHHLPKLRTNTHLYDNAALYIQETVKANTDAEVVVELCSQLKEEGISQYGLLVALECSLRQRRESVAWVLLRALRQGGEVLREHYFWPLLHHIAATNTQQLLECVKEMVGLGVSPGLETVRYHILPGLPSTTTIPVAMVRQLERVGLPARLTATPILVTLIRRNAFSTAAKFVSEGGQSFSLADLTPTLASAWSSNPRTVATLLASLITHHNQRQQRTDKKPEDWGGQFVLDLAASRHSLSPQQIIPLFKELKKNKIGISEESLELVVVRSNPAIQEAIGGAAGLVLDPTLGSPPREKDHGFLPHPRDMSVEELESHLVELEAKGLNQRGALRRLMLVKAATSQTATPANTATGVLDMAKQVSKGGGKLSAGMVASMLKVQVKKGEVEAALATLTLLRSNHPTFRLDHYKVIDLCTLMVKQGRGQEAVEVLRQHLVGEVGNGTGTEAKLDPRNVRRNCRALLVASADTRDYHQTQDLLNLLLRHGLVIPDSLSLGTLIKCRLASGDLAGAVEETEEILEKYKCLPMRIETLINIIDKCGEDISESGSAWGLVQRLVSLIAQHQGSPQAHHDLFFACLEAHRPLLATKVLKKLSDGVEVQRVWRQVERYGQTQRDLPLLHLLTASTSNQTIDRKHIYSTLLNIYCEASEVDKGLALWTRMQEEDLAPSPSFFTSLAALLTAHQRPVPFSIQ